jgi:phosphonate transport system substrate-binding protein
MTPLETAQRWAPVVQALSQAGIPCELVLFSSIVQFEAAFLKGDLDFAYMNPYHLFMARQRHLYEALLRDKRPLEGVLLVKSDGAIDGLEQLEGARISFPAPNSLGASLYIRSVLERQFKVSFQAHYAATHSNALRQVLADDSVAAGVIKTTLEKESPEVRSQLRVIYTTPPLSSNPLVAHPRVPVAVKSALVNTLLGLAQAPATNALMAAIQMSDPIKANFTADYAPLERLNFEEYVVME